MARDRVGIRDLCNHGGDVLQRVQAGEHLIVTRSGKPVAELRPIQRHTLHRDELLARWRNLPHVDPAAFRRDIDETLDAAL